jgi:hypothetical protein
VVLDRQHRVAAATAALLDALLVTLFVVLGRLAHAKGLSLAGVASTAWPFLAGAALGWLAGAVWQHPLRLRRAALPVWVSCVGWGMALRAVSHQGVDAVFLGVASAFLALFLGGWRVVVLVAQRWQSGSGSGKRWGWVASRRCFTQTQQRPH